MNGNSSDRGRVCVRVCLFARVVELKAEQKNKLSTGPEVNAHGNAVAAAADTRGRLNLTKDSTRFIIYSEIPRATTIFARATVG